MKIEWLNAECTEAIVTKGWFRKRQAHVRYGAHEQFWRFVPSRNLVAAGSWLEICLDSERQSRTAKPRQPSDWQPVELPRARLVERKP